MTIAQRCFETRNNWLLTEELVLDEMVKILGGEPDKPGEWPFEDVTCDEVDWDGQSVELTGARPGLTLTDEQLDQVWGLGFTVVRIYYKKAPIRWWHRALPWVALIVKRRLSSISGDWWRVKGYPPGHCPCRRAESR